MPPASDDKFRRTVSCALQPSKFLFEWILRKGMTIGQAKKEILAEQKSRLGVDTPMDR